MNLKNAAVAILVALLLFATVNSPVWAQGRKKNNTPPPRFLALELPYDGTSTAISEANQGTVVVAINATDAGYGSAAFCQINANNPGIAGQGFLPEPPFVDPNDGEFKNGPSSASDVNDNGIIVGRASAFEGDPNYVGTNISPGRGIVWTFNGDSYDYELLPTLNLAETYANGINSIGEIVGRSNGRAVYWDAITHEIVDLNTAVTEALGWELVTANDINDMGLVVGHGILAGQSRGFLLDLGSGAILTVPLIDGADANTAFRVDAGGRVVGPAWNGGGNPYGTNPDHYYGYSWEGPGHDPVILGSVTNNTSTAYGLNDLGDTTGISFIPTDEIWANDWVPTLWESDGKGSVTATELSNEVDGRTNWLLTNCIDINNDGWISSRGRKRVRGRYEWHALLLIPNP